MSEPSATSALGERLRAALTAWAAGELQIKETAGALTSLLSQKDAGEPA